ncbi:type VI secretion system-associated protein TagF [uncultured Tateyamaria sp.]|uniref:type VI secretion system-associated protein TagF n=1 Tax=uncultured Tateyamaria sp. TaxID=455651 RepID=UPI00262493A8|nr:type VI secretion system-associated protein TagF [uncultured Tateyamaria sp.]
MSAATNGRFGAFGKIPALGDFVRLNVSAGFVQPWDAWMQEGMIEVRAALAEAWDDAYMSAPMWRFTLPKGVAGDTGMMGLFMASVDRVGRQYPLTLATPTDATDTALSHFANASLFEHLEQIALSMLDDGNTREVLAGALEPLGPMPPLPMHAPALPYAGPVPLEHMWAGQLLSQQTGGATAIWSTAMDHDHRLMLTRGLPEGRNMRALFDLSPHAWGTQDMAAHI